MSAQGSGTPWYVTSGGQRYGPYPAQILAGWIAAGRIAQEALVSSGGPWISTAKFMELHAKETTPLPPEVTPEQLDEIVSPPDPAAEKTTVKQLEGPKETKSVETAIDDIAPERDRIVVIGRRRSGKT